MCTGELLLLMITCDGNAKHDPEEKKFDQEEARTLDLVRAT